MALVANICERLRTAVVAALVFAFLTASLPTAHTLPCPDPANTQTVSASANVDGVLVHAGYHGSGKRTDRSLDQCCQKYCLKCFSLVPPAALFDGAPVVRDHALPIETQSAGISVHPSHGPPRS